MIYWAPLFHFYQPPIQIHQVLRKVCNESYRPLIEVFRQYPHARATVNICGVLTEMLWENGFGDVIASLKELAEGGHLEFTGSAKYHAILPLISRDEMKRQIRRDYLTNRHFFGEVYSPRGFFPPEMCYSEALIEPLLESRHEWIILSGVACPVDWPTNVIHQIPHGLDRVAVFFRDDILSNRISFQNIDGRGFIEHLKGLRNKNGDSYVITAMDAETFGHHIQNWEKLFLAEVYEALSGGAAHYSALKQERLLSEQHRGLFSEAAEREVQIITISQLMEKFPSGSFVQPRPSSWSTTEDDLMRGNPYPLWKDPSNPIHQMQWEHAEICIGLVRKALELANNDQSRRFAEIARGLLDPALHSCQFWWASKRPMWDINMVHRGLMEQREVILNAYKAIQCSNCGSGEKRELYYRVLAARDLRDKISDRLYFD